jgi:hypothetical protein
MAKAQEREREADERSPRPKFSKVNVLAHLCCKFTLHGLFQKKSST